MKKGWLWLALAGLGVWLLLAIVHSEAKGGVDSHPCLARWARSIGPWREPALASPTAALAQNRGPLQARAAAPGSPVVDLVPLTEGGVGPPWMDGRGPPGKVPGTLVDYGLPARPVAQGKRGGLTHPCSPTRPYQERVLQQALASSCMRIVRRADARACAPRQAHTNKLPSLKGKWAC